MNADAKKIVKALRGNASVVGSSISAFGPMAHNFCAAADLIESLQAQNSDLKDQLGHGDLVFAAYQSDMEKLQAQLAESQRRERAAVEDMKLIVDAVREEHCDETCCFACKFDCDTSITDSGCHANECPGFERDDCFEWRGPQGAGKGE